MPPRFHIWKGNVKVVVDKPDNIQQNMPTPKQAASHKFDTCKHRSEEKELTLRTCCSTVQKRGYHCNKLNLDFINVPLCFGCKSYESKEGTQT